MAASYKQVVQIRWSDLDPNLHLRHSVYYDFGAYLRIRFLEEQGLTSSLMAEKQIGPVLFREECVFKRELRLNDRVTIDLQLLKIREDYSRWTIQHHIYKNEDVLAAVLTVDGAWIDIVQRKLAVPPQQVLQVFEQMPRADQFEWIKK